MTEYYECPNCEQPIHTYIHDTQLYQKSNPIAGGYESDSSWDLNPDDESSNESPKNNSEPNSESEDDGPIIRRKQKTIAGDSNSAADRGSTMSFTEVSSKFTSLIKAARMPI